MQSSKISILKNELTDTFKSWRYVLYRAYVVRKLQSRNSALGLVFEPLLLVISSVAIATVWNKIFGRGGGEFFEFFVYVFISFSMWYLVADLVGSGADSLRKNANAATNTNEPLSLYVVLEVCNAFMNFLLRLPLMIVVSIYHVGLPVAADLFILLYGLILLALSGLGFGLWAGIYGLFFGDLRVVVNSIMRVAFLLTPIIWHVERLGAHANLIYLNPFYSYLTVCRSAFFGHSVDMTAIKVATISTALVLFTGFLTLVANKRKARTGLFSV